MAHVREEFALRATGLLCRFLGTLHFGFGPLVLFDFFSEFLGPLLDTNFELILGAQQRRITLLNALQHVVERTDKRPDLVISYRGGSQRIVLFTGNPAGKLS